MWFLQLFRGQIDFASSSSRGGLDRGGKLHLFMKIDCAPLMNRRNLNLIEGWLKSFSRKPSFGVKKISALFSSNFYCELVDKKKCYEN